MKTAPLMQAVCHSDRSRGISYYCFPILASLANRDPEESGDSARHDKKLLQFVGMRHSPKI
jgi:hypothetical protein